MKYNSDTQQLELLLEKNNLMDNIVRKQIRKRKEKCILENDPFVKLRNLGSIKFPAKHKQNIELEKDLAKINERKFLLNTQETFDKELYPMLSLKLSYKNASYFTPMGLYNYYDKRITIAHNYSYEWRFSVLIHEMGHAFLHQFSDILNISEYKLFKIFAVHYFGLKGFNTSKWSFSRNKSHLGKYVSDYAKTNMHEAFSELFLLAIGTKWDKDEWYIKKDADALEALNHLYAYIKTAIWNKSS